MAPPLANASKALTRAVAQNTAPDRSDAVKQEFVSHISSFPNPFPWYIPPK